MGPFEDQRKPPASSETLAPGLRLPPVQGPETGGWWRSVFSILTVHIYAVPHKFTHVYSGCEVASISFLLSIFAFRVMYNDHTSVHGVG